MTDFIDQAVETGQRQLDAAIAATRAPIAVGVPDACAGCDRDMPRLVGGLCGFCRDGRPG